MVDGWIMSVDIIDGGGTNVGETEGLGKAAIDRLKESIKNRNTWDVDKLTGASLTSNAIRESAKEAINQITGE
jgi:uncharacterized protein with FMN-binding domain